MLRKFVGFVAAALLPAWFVYVIYGWITYSGAWQYVAERQIEWFGSYSEKPNFLALLFGGLLAWLPVFWLVRTLLPGAVPQWAVRVAQSKPLVGPGDPNKLPGGGSAWVLIALVAILAGAGVGWFGYQKSQEPMVFTPFDAAAAPPSGVRHVAVSGIAQTGMIVTLEHTGTGDKRTETYLPLTPPQWRQGDPVTYFMLPRINAYSIGSQYAMIESRTRPFPMTLKGSLFSNGLPGLVRAEYEKSGLKLAPTTYLIDGKADADLEIYFGLAFAGVLLGLVLLLSAGIIKFKQRRAKPA